MLIFFALEHRGEKDFVRHCHDLRDIRLPGFDHIALVVVGVLDRVPLWIEATDHATRAVVIRPGAMARVAAVGPSLARLRRLPRRMSRCPLRVRTWAKSAASSRGSSVGSHVRVWCESRKARIGAKS